MLRRLSLYFKGMTHDKLKVYAYVSLIPIQWHYSRSHSTVFLQAQLLGSMCAI